MREYSAKEIAYYNHMFKVPSVVVANLDTKVRYRLITVALLFLVQNRTALFLSRLSEADMFFPPRRQTRPASSA